MEVPDKRVKNVAVNKKVTIMVRRMINASLSVQYVCPRKEHEFCRFSSRYCFTVVPLLVILFSFGFSPV